MRQLAHTKVYTVAMATDSKSASLPRPPYLPASTFLTTIDSWRSVRPSRVERGVLTKVAGSMQTWLIAALKYFQLIDEDGSPTPRLDALATASDEERRKLIAEMLRRGYPFLFAKGVDISNITYSDLKKRFEQTGAQGETAVKAISFFTGMAKAAGMTVSPFVATRRRSSSDRRKRSTGKANATRSTAPLTPFVPASNTTKTPMQVLIEMLDVTEMDKEEQAAVWTLIRYLKKGGS
jgi:uncharacterized protein DUF5343